MKYTTYRTDPDWRLIGIIILLLILGGLHFFRGTTAAPTAKTEVYRDTIYSTVADTVYVDKIKYVTLEIPKPDTVYINDTAISKYSQEYTDSMISADFVIEVDGVLVSHNFSYKTSFPKYIYTRDTIRINTNTTKHINKAQLFLGLEVGGNEGLFNFGPTLTLKGKNNYLYSYRYGVLDKTHNVGVARVLTFKK